MTISSSDRHGVECRLLLWRVRAVLRHLRDRLADKGEAVLLVHVPMEHVELVPAHGGGDPLEGADGEVVAAGIDQEAAVAECGTIPDPGSIHNLKNIILTNLAISVALAISHFWP